MSLPTIFSTNRSPSCILTDDWQLLPIIYTEDQSKIYKHVLPPNIQECMDDLHVKMVQAFGRTDARLILDRNRERTFKNEVFRGVHVETTSPLTLYALAKERSSSIVGLIGFVPIYCSNKPVMTKYRLFFHPFEDFSLEEQIRVFAIALAAIHMLTSSSIRLFLTSCDDEDLRVISHFPHLVRVEAQSEEDDVHWYEFPRDSATPKSCLFEQWPARKRNLYEDA